MTTACERREIADRKLWRQRREERARERGLERMRAQQALKPPAPVQICIVDGCTKAQFSNRLCTTHYERKRKGRTMDGQRITMLVRDSVCLRFLSLPRSRP